MAWQIRPRDEDIDPKDLYVAESENLSIKLFHGGKLNGFARKSYVGGEIDYVDLCDADTISVEELRTMARELGHQEDLVFFYVEPGRTIDTGLKVLRTDAAILQMCQWVTTNKLMDVYCIKDAKFPNIEYNKHRANLNPVPMVPPKKKSVQTGASSKCIEESEVSKNKKHEDVGASKPVANSGKQKNVGPSKVVEDSSKSKGKRVVVELGSSDDGEADGTESDSSHDEEDRFTDDDDYCVEDELLYGEKNEEKTEGDKRTSKQPVKSQPDEVFVGPSQVTQESNLEVERPSKIEDEAEVEEVEAGNSAPKIIPECNRGRKRRVKVCAKKAKKKSKSQGRMPPSPAEQNEEQEGVDDGEFTLLMDNAVDDELRSTHGSTDDEGESVEPEYVDFNPEKDMREPKFQLRMRFASSKEFKDAIKSYSIWKRKALRFTTNERHRVRVKCAANCPWVCFASVVKSSGTSDLIVKTLVDKHENCDHAYKNKHLTAKWIAGRYEERVRSNMNIPVREIRQTIDEDCEATITPVVAYRARSLARENIIGSAAAQYGKIWEYCDEIRRTHPNSTMVVEHTPFRTESGNCRFMRLYCCLGPLKAGFKICRPVIGLDGCHIKGPYRGQLLTAIGVDPSNGWWPIAWAVVEKEATEQWKWFIELLQQDIEIENQFHYTFISDQQKGLDRALSEVLPNSEHRYCVQHMYRNFKKKHPGKVLKNMLWAIARSSNMELFKNAMKALEEYDSEAFGWVKKAPHPSHWCMAFFNPITKCDMLTNNLCESFNSHILDARDKPILALMESIRELVMERIQKRLLLMSRYKHPTGPLIRKIVEERVKDSFFWKPIYNGVDGYQMRGPRGAQFAVDLRKEECSCGLWAISGIPCCHGIVALKHKGIDVHDSTHDCFKKQLFISVYENVLYPINGQNLWPLSAIGLNLDPPIACVQPGRPKKARRRDTDEGKNHGTKLRRIIKIHCRKCGGGGHNAASCKNVPPTAEGTSEQPANVQQPVVQPSNSRPKKLPTRRKKTMEAEGTSQQPQPNPPNVRSQIPPSSRQPQTPAQPLRRSPRKASQVNLTDGDKCRINANCAWLGKPIPYTVGGWKRGGMAAFGRGSAKRGRSSK